MSKKTIVLALTLLLALLITIPASAITYGAPEDPIDPEHPFVGLLAFYDAEGEFVWRCTGSLLSPTFVLTAGHCTAPDGEDVPARVRFYLDPTVFYDPILDDYTNETYYMGTPVVNPEYDWAALPNHHDVAAVIMDEPVPGITEFGELPTLNLMNDVVADTHHRDVIMTNVGYGVNDYTPPTKVVSLRTRYFSQGFLVSIDNAASGGWNIQTSGNHGQWTGSEDLVIGGTCGGDSGGPVIVGGFESNTIVGVTSFGNAYCNGNTDFSYRVDIAESLEFLSQFAEAHGFVIP